MNGTPVSVQRDNEKAKQAWKEQVRAAALAALEPGAWAFDQTRLAVTLYYFPQAPMGGDIDNIVKFILDAMAPVIYLDDGLIDRLLVQRFEPPSIFNFIDPSDVLLQALEAEEPILYIRLDKVFLEDLQP